MAGVRFEDVDLLGALSRIVDLHTQHYKEDFDLDKDCLLYTSGNTGWICGIYLSPYQHGGKRSGL